VKVDWEDRAPECPKCGQKLRSQFGVTVDERLRAHVRALHADSIGRAHAHGRDSFSFAYLRPVTGTTEAWWHVLMLDGPALVTKLRVASWEIEWAVTPELSQARGTVQA